MAVHVEHKGNEVYIYMNGQLTMKRWIKQERSVVFNRGLYPQDRHTLVSITDQGIKKNY